ncbi:MAG: serine/threonine protein kinase [Symplocastrum torsivum CPER-KK1]|uniref:non-specific serine/threonine protein kinase n=1 Tax=Symplocastrum torsivum CPER-KK1 TaxID=450513 RepID=A0A951UB72_9CYAN|nr:serine/threonine protein kinase [Symplocastrum torsivum CPER-KK1]
MSYCLNPSCPSPQNPASANFCRTCGAKLLLKERYRTLKPIGQGGFGKTFLAVDEDKPSQPRCVIKQFFPQAQGTNTVQKAAELFTQEAVRLDELGKHPQIPELLAYFSQDSQQYLVQEFIDGKDLAHELTEKGVFNEAQVRSLLNDLLPVLQFVHQHQVIHRDIKPENIIRRHRDSQLVLVDFGASKVASGTALARTGTAIGSAGYSAPEQNIGRAVFASDIYGLGVTCIHLLTGRHPFDLFDANEGIWVWRDACSQPVSVALGRILDKMLESAINRRYQSAAEVLRDLNSQTPPTVVKSQTPTLPPTPPIKSQPPVPKSTPAIDAELAELKSQFLGTPTPKTPSQKPTSQAASSPSPPKSKTQIDLELEELKSQFLGSTNPNKPPTQT